LRCAEGSWMPCGLVASKVFFLFDSHWDLCFVEVATTN
jgi:hypothetical protein